ncbi:DUF4352 domain-containing protein [Actinoplanes sp. NPDC051494]|uniref:DUF4352 domain-containing protein n=1 Tax=Actinoplanes sp. NPDC051494 TaxID=3363907 RepID=UPI0037AF4EFB
MSHPFGTPSPGSEPNQQPYPGAPQFQPPHAGHPYPQPYPGQQFHAGQPHPGLPGQPYPGTPGRPAKKTSPARLILGGVGVFFLLVCGASALASGSDDDKSSTSAAAEESDTAEPGATTAAAAKPAATKKSPAAKRTTQPPAADETAGGMGDTVSDGDIAFTVKDMDCSKTEVGSEYFNQKAQGKFCIITITVKNNGDSAHTFSGSDVTAYDAKGTEYDNDTTAELYANEDASTFLEKINPGNKITGKVIFDVPKSTTLTEVELDGGGMPFVGVHAKLS